MGIEYTMIGPKGEGPINRRACWSGYNTDRRSLTQEGLAGPHGPWRTRLELGQYMDYWENTTVPVRNLTDKVFDKLYGKWFHPDWVSYQYVKGRKARTGVTYSSSCPYWIMCSSSSIYRMWDDMPLFMEYWKRVDDVQKYVGYRMKPWTQYFLVTNINQRGLMAYDFRADRIDVGYTTGHMPIDGDYGDIATIQHMQGWNADRFINGDTWYQPLPSMYAEYMEVKGPTKEPCQSLSYSGRDAHFAGFSTNRRKTWITEEMADKSGPDPSNPYAVMKADVYLPEFIEKVLKPLGM